MTKPMTKSGVVGVLTHVRDKLLTHAEMVKGRPVNEATLALLPSGEQCAQLAEWLGAALAELEKAPDADRTAFTAALGSATSREYTSDELKKWWVSECPKCKWSGLSRDCEGGGALADTGDYDDVVCPECYKREEWVAVNEAESPNSVLSKPSSDK